MGGQCVNVTVELLSPNIQKYKQIQNVRHTCTENWCAICVRKWYSKKGGGVRGDGERRREMKEMTPTYEGNLSCAVHHAAFAKRNFVRYEVRASTRSRQALRRLVQWL